MSQDSPMEFKSESDWLTESGGGGGEILFERFRLVNAPGKKDSKLGAGGMGVVHLAEDLLLKHYVALKIPPTDLAGDSEARREMLEETKRGLKLTHSNIVRVFDFHASESNWGISMQYVDGKNLSDMRAEGIILNPDLLDVEDIKPWLHQICEALSYAHEVRNMVHRDLTPRNIMLEKSGAAAGKEYPYRAYLMDFGIADNIYHSIARTVQKSASSEVLGPGARPYISPGQLRGEAAKAADDIYSLGALLYDLFTSKPPFFRREGIEYQVQTQVPPSISERRKELNVKNPVEVPASWEEVIHACLEKNPADRPRSVREVSNRLGLNPDRHFEAEVVHLKNQLLTAERRLVESAPEKVVAGISRRFLLTMGVAGAVGAGAAYLLPQQLFRKPPPGIEKAVTRARPGMDYTNGSRGSLLLASRSNSSVLIGRDPVNFGSYQDYRRFIEEESDNIYEAKSLLPVTGVTRYDAERFCLWLTAVEIEAGNIPDDAAYSLPDLADYEENRERLSFPSDQEWLARGGAGNEGSVVAQAEEATFRAAQVEPFESGEGLGFRCVLRFK